MNGLGAWASMRSGSLGAADNNNNQDLSAAYVLFTPRGGGSYGIVRSFFDFDTSGITVAPSSATFNMSTGDFTVEAWINLDNFDIDVGANPTIFGNSGGSISSGSYRIPIRNADGLFLDSSDNELYVIIRYKGDPAPISAITLSYS